MVKSSKRIQVLCALLVAGFSLYIWPYFLSYVWAIVRFPYDWEPTDGDHLNIVFRILHRQNIYSNWHDGAILNLYNPGFHYLMAALSPWVAPTLSSGRTLSAFAFFGCVAFILAAVMTYKSNLSRTMRISIASLVALCTVSVDFENMTMDLIHISPNTLYTFWALASLYCLFNWDQSVSDDQPRKLWPLALCAVFATFAYLTKQQGVYCPVTVFVVLALRHARKSEWALFTVVAGGLTLAAIAYLEIRNHGTFLRSTLLNVPQVYRSPFHEAQKRIIKFSYQSSPWVLLTLAGLVAQRDARKWNVWQISVPIQLIFLFQTAGNVNGGPNYFFSFWCTLLICSGVTAIDFFANESSRLGFSSCRPRILTLGFLLILPNLLYADILNPVILTKLLPNRAVLDPMMKSNYDKIRELVEASSNKEVLVDRVIGGWVVAGAEVENEFCTLINAWYSKSDVFNRPAFLEKIRTRKYAFIVSGLIPIPDEVMVVVNEVYRPSLTMTTNLWMGQVVSDVTVYAPK